MFSIARSPRPEDTRTILPPLSFMYLAAEVAMNQFAFTFTAKIFSHISSVTSRALVRGREMPAVETTMSMPPNSSTVLVSIASMSLCLVPSQNMPIALPPSALSSSAVSRQICSGTPQIITFAPAAQRACAVALPIPEPPPITTAVLPASCSFGSPANQLAIKTLLFSLFQGNPFFFVSLIHTISDK